MQLSPQADIQNQTEPNNSAAKIMQWADHLATFTAMEGGLLRAYLTPEHKLAWERFGPCPQATLFPTQRQR